MIVPKKPYSIDGQEIGPNHPPYCVAEVGINHNGSIKLAKKAIRSKADYIAFGAFNVTKTKKIKYKADVKILNEANKITNIPIVAIGGVNSNNFKNLLLNKANLLAISSYIWNNKKYKPLEAIKILI